MTDMDFTNKYKKCKDKHAYFDFFGIDNSLQKNQSQRRKQSFNYGKIRQIQKEDLYKTDKDYYDNSKNKSALGQNYTFAQLQISKSLKKYENDENEFKTKLKDCHFDNASTQKQKKLKLSLNELKSSNLHDQSFPNQSNCSCSQIVQQEHTQQQIEEVEISFSSSEKNINHKKNHHQMNQQYNQQSNQSSSFHNQNLFEDQELEQNIFTQYGHRVKINIKEQMLKLKAIISQKEIKIQKLQERLYYYECLCKRLLKQDSKNKQIYKAIHEKYAEQASKVKKAEIKILRLQDQINKIKFEYKQKQNMQVFRFQPFNQHIPVKDNRNSLIKNDRILHMEDQKQLKAKQNLKQTMNNKLLTDLRAKNQNLLKINQILQIQISDSNKKIVELQSQIHQFTHKQYQDYIKKIKDDNRNKNTSNINITRMNDQLKQKQRNYN